MAQLGYQVHSLLILDNTPHLAKDLAAYHLVRLYLLWLRKHAKNVRFEPEPLQCLLLTTNS